MTRGAAAVHRSVSRRRRHGPGAAGRVRRGRARVWAPPAPLPAWSRRARAAIQGTTRRPPAAGHGAVPALRHRQPAARLAGARARWASCSAASRPRGWPDGCGATSSAARGVSGRSADVRRRRRRRGDGVRRQAGARLHQRAGAHRRRAAVGRQLDLHRHLLRRRLRAWRRWRGGSGDDAADRNRLARAPRRAAGGAAHRVRVRLVPGARRAWAARRSWRASST